MLHPDVISKETLQLLIKLMSDKKMSTFNLVGGTALSLYLGHRLSVDLDLFSANDFDSRIMMSYLNEHYGFQESFIRENTLKGRIDKVEVDLITYNYPMVKPLHLESGLRLASMEDIIAMKLSAITDNGTRMKDFVDIAFLSTKFSLNSMISFYLQKFKGANELSVLKAITYFDDIQIDIISLKNGVFDWKLIDGRLHDMQKHPEHLFYKQLPVGMEDNNIGRKLR
jgi:hypothetical protein